MEAPVVWDLVRPSILPIVMRKTQHELARIELLKILSTEIQKDGGASLVVCLKEYSSTGSIDKLLSAAGGSKKLLTFLELYPHIFEVDRLSLPHFVKLLSDEYCCCPAVTSGRSSSSSWDAETNALQKRVLCVLRKRSARITRNQKIARQPVSSIWLLKECTSCLHCYLRASGEYQKLYADCHQVHVKGTSEWRVLVKPLFEEFLRKMEGIVFENGTISLQEKVLIDDEPFLRELATQLGECVDNDRAKHISLKLLLHRRPVLKELLGGRDLLQIVQDHASYFADTAVVFVHQGGDVYLRSKNKTQKSGGRLQVDQVGLFSVAGSKWGGAMVSRLVSACHLVHLDRNTVTAIDLTASVGGLTLELAKTFSNVIAIEIDSHRAELCAQNMLNRGVGNVVVRNVDAMKAIPDLPSASMVMIDPPFGGVYYKSEKKPIFMGKWELEEVVEAVARFLNPVVVGMRLPVAFDIDALEETLRRKGLCFEISTSTSKLGPQLFVVWAFPLQT